MHVYKDTLNNIKLQAHEQHNPEYQPIIFFYNFVKKKLLQQKKSMLLFNPQGPYELKSHRH